MDSDSEAIIHYVFNWSWLAQLQNQYRPEKCQQPFFPTSMRRPDMQGVRITWYTEAVLLRRSKTIVFFNRKRCFWAKEKQCSDRFARAMHYEKRSQFVKKIYCTPLGRGTPSFEHTQKGEQDDASRARTRERACATGHGCPTPGLSACLLFTFRKPKARVTPKIRHTQLVRVT